MLHKKEGTQTKKALPYLTVVENDNTRVSVILLLHLIFRVDAFPLDLGAQIHTINADGIKGAQKEFA